MKTGPRTARLAGVSTRWAEKGFFVPYLELFNPQEHPNRRGVMHSGFGLGMGRLIQFLLGATEVIVF